MVELCPGRRHSAPSGLTAILARRDSHVGAAGMSVGYASPQIRLRTHVSRKSRIDRPCARRLSQTVSIRSTKRDPAALAEPNEPFRHNTAFRSALSAMQCRAPGYAASGRGGPSPRAWSCRAACLPTRHRLGDGVNGFNWPAPRRAPPDRFERASRLSDVPRGSRIPEMGDFQRAVGLAQAGRAVPVHERERRDCVPPAGTVSLSSELRASGS